MSQIKTCTHANWSRQLTLVRKFKIVLIHTPSSMDYIIIKDRLASTRGTRTHPGETGNSVPQWRPSCWITDVVLRNAPLGLLILGKQHYDNCITLMQMSAEEKVLECKVLLNAVC